MVEFRRRLSHFASAPPQIQSFGFGDESINTGDAVGVHCIANKGDLPVDIHWILNSSPIISGQNGVTVMKMNQRTSSLSINSVEGMHRGIYKCLVSNLAGTVEHSAELRVNGSLRTTPNTCCGHVLLCSAVFIAICFVVDFYYRFPVRVHSSAHSPILAESALPSFVSDNALSN